MAYILPAVQLKPMCDASPTKMTQKHNLAWTTLMRDLISTRIFWSPASVKAVVLFKILPKVYLLIQTLWHLMRHCPKKIDKPENVT